MPCMAMYAQPQSGINVGRLLRKACAAKELSLKQAAIWMSGTATYEATLNRAVHGLAPLDAHALANLPTSVLWKFFRLLINAKLKAEESDLFANERKQA